MQFAYMTGKTDAALAQRIRKLRASFGEGQSTFGARFGVEQATVSRWEKGYVPKRTLWQQIAQAAATTPSEFFFGVEADETEEAETAAERSPTAMGSRLRLARIDAGFTSARSAAIKFGWTVSTYAAHENGQNDFDPDTAAAYAKHLKTTAAWLLTGAAPESKRRASVVRSFDPDAPEQPEDPDAPAERIFPPDAIRELLARPGMGGGQTIATTYVRDGQEIVQRDAVADDYWRLPPDFVRFLGARPVDLLVTRGKGDSMAPTIMPDEPVIVNIAHKQPSPDGIYAIRDPLGEVVLKRLELFGVNPPRVRIISDNPKHTPQERGLDEIEIVGKALIGLKLF